MKMNRRNVFKTVVAGIAAWLAAPFVISNKPQSKAGSDDFIEWMRTNVPPDLNPRILVAGWAKSGKTTLMTLLFMRYVRGACYISVPGEFAAAKNGRKAVDLAECTLTRPGAVEAEHPWTANADLMLIVRQQIVERERKVLVLVAKNRYGYGAGFCFDITDYVAADRYAVAAQKIFSWRLSVPIIVDREAWPQLVDVLEGAI